MSPKLLPEIVSEGTASRFLNAKQYAEWRHLLTLAYADKITKKQYQRWTRLENLVVDRLYVFNEVAE